MTPPEQPGDELLQRGRQLAGAGQFSQAIDLFQRLLDEGSDDPAVSVELGYALKDAGQKEAAIEALTRGLKRAPGHLRLLNAHGLVLSDLGRLDEALAEFDKAWQANPQSAGSHSNAARTLLALGQPDRAAARAREALALDPVLVQALQTLRAALFDSKQVDAAIALCQDVVSHLGTSDATLGLRATCYEDLGMHQEALASWLALAQTARASPETTFNAALAALRLDDYRQGWLLWSQRSLARLGDLASQGLDLPHWTGSESIEGCSILIYPEQGMGDCIQFARYLTKLHAHRPAQVTLAFPAALEPLYRNLEGVRVLKQGEQVGHADLQCSVASLPSCLLRAGGDADIPAPLKPELDALKVQRWSALLGAGHRPRIGIAVSGNPDHHNDRNRSISLDLLQPLAAEGFELICLQRDLRLSDQASARRMDLRFFGAQMEDFSDTAALISLCRRVVSVDSAPAHLAASMGLETLLLLPFLADWRWGVGHQHSSWYRSMRLFRQDARREWNKPIAQLINTLRDAR